MLMLPGRLGRIVSRPQVPQLESSVWVSGLFTADVQVSTSLTALTRQVRDSRYLK